MSITSYKTIKIIAKTLLGLAKSGF